MAEILWSPTDARKKASALWAFAEKTAPLHGCAPDDYDALHHWSVREPAAYHEALWDFCGLVGTRGARIVADGDGMQTTRFFPDAQLNYAENLLQGADDRLAIIAHRDDGTRRTITRKALAALVSRIVLALRAEGVGAGDRVGAIVINDIESIACYLASAAIGAIWASCSPDFGPAAATDRLEQVAPTILFAVPVYGYAGKVIDILATIDAVASATGVRRIVLLGSPVQASHARPHIGLEDWLAPHADGAIEYHRGGFSDPMVILFSSGTTGKPKCIMHSAGGLLIQHIKEQRLHADIKPGDRFFYYTTCGWMMWNWLISGLASDAVLVTYDGNPFHPWESVLFDLIDQEGIAIFGTSAKYIDACAKAGVKPAKTNSLASLQTVLSTGSPLLPASFDYIYRDWKADVHLASISGGTDICACFLGGVPTAPVRRGELQGAQLGLDVAIFDDAGHPVIGVSGELVCRNAHISMPVGFWGDAEGKAYNAAYFERFESVWAHGDFAEKRDGCGYVIHGRSDNTLNPGGVRIGTAEIYRLVESLPAIREAVAVGQDRNGDQRVILFVTLNPRYTFDTALHAHIRKRIREGATPRHVPSQVVVVRDIPRTRSGKISESAVRDFVNKRPVKNILALANAECLVDFNLDYFDE